MHSSSGHCRRSILSLALIVVLSASTHVAEAQFGFGGGGFGGGGFGGGGSFGGGFGGSFSGFGGGSSFGGGFSGFGGGSSFSGFSGGGGFSGFGGGSSFGGGMSHPQPVYSQPQPVYVQPQTTTIVVQPTAPAAAPAPAPAKVEPNDVKVNSDEPLPNSVDVINFGLTGANRAKAVRDLTDARLNLNADIEATLGDSLKDQNVAMNFDKFVEATNKGGPDNLSSCRRALESAHARSLANNSNLTSVTRRQRQRNFQRDLDQQEGVVRALNALTRPSPKDAKLEAGGLGTIVYWPQLPNGEMVFVAADVVFCGVGRSGPMEVRCESAEEFGSILGIALVPGQPLPPSSGGDTSGVILDNPASATQTVKFTVNGQSLSLPPGYFQRLAEGKTYRVVFDRGGGKGNASYALETGTYQFWLENNGWDLWKMSFNVVIDNSANRQDFHFVFDGKQLIAKAQKSVELQSAYAPVVRFDQGKGEKPALRELAKGVYRVGVTPGGLDLFAASEPASPLATTPNDTAVAALQPPKAETAAPPPTQPAATTPVAAPSGEDNLRIEITQIAKAVKQYLDGRGEASICVGKFPSPAEDAIQKTLKEELARLDIAIKDQGNLTIDGRVNDAKDRKTQRFAIQLSWQIRDRQAEVLIEAERSIFPSAALAALFGPPAELPGPR